jgi:hypothetical protein
MTWSTAAVLRSITLSAALVAGCAAVTGAQTLPASSPQSAVLASGIQKAFNAARTSTQTSSQPASSQTSSADEGWNVGIYPVFVWVPTSIDIEVELPPDSGGDAGSIVDSRFDGAYLGGFYASKGWFRVDADGVWAAIGGDRSQPPVLQVDVDLIYFHATGGVRLTKGLYATGGVRRLALKYDIKLGDFPNFARKPGVWDPLIGIGYHHEGAGKALEFHASFEGGGFGVGTDVEYAGMARVDWKPISHFGITAGYSVLYFKVEDTVRDRTFTVAQTVHGPLAGIGFYF